MPPEQVGDYNSLYYNPRHQFCFGFAVYAEDE